MAVRESQCPCTAPSPTKNFRPMPMLRMSPRKRGQRSLKPTPSKPRYPTLAFRPVLLGVYGSPGSSVSVGMGRMRLPRREGAQRPHRVDDPDLYGEPVHPCGNRGYPDRPRGLLQLVLLVLGAVG